MPTRALDTIVALAVARKMDDAASARPSRRFPASSDLAFSTELELDAEHYPPATRCLCLPYPLASMIPVGSTTRGEKAAQIQGVGRVLLCRYSAGDSIRHPRRTPALPACSPHAMPAPSSRQAGRQAGCPLEALGGPWRASPAPPPVLVRPAWTGAQAGAGGPCGPWCPDVPAEKRVYPSSTP